MNKIKFFSLTASIALAITFTSCASKPPVQEPAAQPVQQTVAAPPVQQPAAQPVQQTAPPPVQQPEAVAQQPAPSYPDDGYEPAGFHADSLRALCRKIKDSYCGIGIATSNKEQGAHEIAVPNARADVTAELEAKITSASKRGFVNTVNDSLFEVTVKRIMQEVASSVSVLIEKTQTQYNKKEKKYRVYALGGAKKDEILKAAKEKMHKISNDQAIIAAENAEEFLKKIDEILDGEKQ